MGTNECSQPASKSSWDSQDFGDVNMVLKWSIFTSPLGHNELNKSAEPMSEGSIVSRRLANH